MKLTLLEIVDLLLNDLGGDPVNSISDTYEATQIAKAVKETFISLYPKLNLRDQENVFELVSSGDSSKPVVMYKPSDVSQIYWIKYNKRNPSSGIDNNFVELEPMNLSSFLDRMYTLESTDPGIETTDLLINGDTITLLYHNDRHPSYFTSIDDNTIIFDAYDKSIESTLQNEQTLCFGKKHASFELRDDFILPLDSDQIAMIIQDTKSQLFVDQRQQPNAKAEQRSKHLYTASKSRDPSIIGWSYNMRGGDGLANFGRKRR